MLSLLCCIGEIMEKFITSFKAAFYLNFIKGAKWKWLVKGLGVTLQIALVAVIIGTVLGAVTAIIRLSYEQNGKKVFGFPGFMLKVGNALCKFYVTVIRGTPVIVQLLIMFFVIMASSKNGQLVATLTFGINSGAYVSEIFRSGFLSVDNGQFEAGRSLGLSYMQTMVKVIMPQAVRTIIPTLCNEFITLLKETSVAGYVAVTDLTRAGDLIRGSTMSAFMPLFAVALIYLALVAILTKLVGVIEKKLKN